MKMRALPGAFIIPFYINSDIHAESNDASQ